MDHPENTIAGIDANLAKIKAAAHVAASHAFVPGPVKELLPAVVATLSGMRDMLEAAETEIAGLRAELAELAEPADPAL